MFGKLRERCIRRKYFHCNQCREFMCVACHASIGKDPRRRVQILRSRIDPVKDIIHLIKTLADWPESPADIYQRADFLRRTDVDWRVQIDQHGDGRDGPKYAFSDPFFHVSDTTPADKNVWKRQKKWY